MTIVPKSAQSQILAVAVSPQQWAEILKPSDEDDPSPQQGTELKSSTGEEMKPSEEVDDVIWMGDEEDGLENDVHPAHERERRSAYLILRCLQGEGLL